MLEWVILGSVFVIVVTASFLVVRGWTSYQQHIDRRLSDTEEASPFEERQLILGDMTAPLGSLTSADPAKQAELAQELREAGYYRRTALMEYSAVQAVLIVTPLIVSVLLVLTTVDEEWAFWVLGAGVLLAFLGYSLPRIYINFRARQRAREIERGLPVAVDLLALCLTGGQNVFVAINRVAHDLDFAFPTLARVANRGQTCRHGGARMGHAEFCRPHQSR